MSWNRLLSACGVVVAVCLVTSVVWTSLANQFRRAEEIDNAHHTIAMMVLEARERGLRTESLMEEVEVLTTTKHKEALRLVMEWADVCRHLPLERQVGDVLCELVALDGFPDRKFRLAVWRNLEAVRALTINQCRLVDGEKPKVCVEMVALK